MELLKNVRDVGKNPVPIVGIDTSDSSGNEQKDGYVSRVAECAYFKSEARGFVPGHEINDWLAAETEVSKE